MSKSYTKVHFLDGQKTGSVFQQIRVEIFDERDFLFKQENTV